MANTQLSRTFASRRSIDRGAITLWLILLLPILVLVLGIVVDLGQMWLARVELENAMEASSLAAVKEWGDANGGSTLRPREVGVLFAAANTVQDQAVAIGLNYDEDGGPNQNASCEGNLVFGAITSRERPWVFEAGVVPSCGFGRVLVDASAQGNLTADNSWGISYYANNEMNDADVLIERIIIDVDPSNEDVAYFEGVANLSDNQPQPAVVDRQQNFQPDNFGWFATPPSVASSTAPPSNQIKFSFDDPSPTHGNPRRLIIDFQSYQSDAGFSPGDRFRFGAGVRVLNPSQKNYGEASADEVGQIHTKIIAYFRIAGQTVGPVEGTMLDSGGRSRDCIDGLWTIDDLGHQHLVVHPDRIVDLPCPPNASANAAVNGQSRTILGGPDRPFAVRAQATVQVSSLICHFAGSVFGPYEVSACATARYNCETGRPELVRVRRENFICP